MLWGEEKRLCILYALTPMHAGAGQALKAVDLPIQRERHTAWPMVQASGIKGALRDWCSKAWKKEGFDTDLTERIFGPEGETDTHWAGAVTLTDARLLAFPVRSQVAPFVHVTSPAVLKRLKEDLEILSWADLPSSLPQVVENEFIPLCGDLPKEVVLEDLVTKKKDTKEDGWSALLKNLCPEIENLLLISNEAYNLLVCMATEVQAHIAIDNTTGTVKEGSLRYQEYLPADSVLYFLAFFANERSRKDQFKSAAEVAYLVTQKGAITHLQIGGDFTLGKGICRVRWLSSQQG